MNSQPHLHRVPDFDCQRSCEPLLRAAYLANAGVAVCDPGGCFVYLNREHAHLLGYPNADALIGRHWSTVYAGADGASFDREIQADLIRTGHWSGRMSARRKDGSLVVLDIEFDRASNGYTHSRCCAESEARRLQARLSEPEQLYRTVLEHAPVAIGIKDSRRRWTFLNGHALQLFGVTLDQMLDKSTDGLESEVATKIEETDRKVLETGEPMSYEIAMTVAGQLRHFRSLKVRIGDEASPSRHMVAAVWVDVTADRHLQQQAEDLVQQQQKYLLMQREFVSLVSHEFRTPLATMQGVLYLLQSTKNADPAKTTRWLGMIRNAVTTLAQLAEEVLELNRMGSAVGAAKSSDLPLAVFINQYVANIVDLHGHPHLVAEIDPSAPEAVSANPSLLRTILDHYTSNALKYTPPESPVRVCVSRLPQRVRVAVVDSGPGLSPAEIARLWQPFFRSTATQHIPGTGLGLAIAKRAAELMGGTVGAESTQGAGCSFWVDLPLS